MRYVLGETRIAQSRPGSLREKYGIFGGINCVHLSETEKWRHFLPLDKVEAELERDSTRPDHTYHLRSLAAQIAGGTHAGLAALEIKELLKEETDLEGEQLQAFYRIILGALTS